VTVRGDVPGPWPISSPRSACRSREPTGADRQRGQLDVRQRESPGRLASGEAFVITRMRGTANDSLDLRMTGRTRPVRRAPSTSDPLVRRFQSSLCSSGSGLTRIMRSWRPPEPGRSQRHRGTHNPRTRTASRRRTPRSWCCFHYRIRAVTGLRRRNLLPGCSHIRCSRDLLAREPASSGLSPIFVPPLVAEARRRMP